MNGALGFLRGYMWPQGGNPASRDARRRSPLCLFVEFDSVSLGNDEVGRPRSFFPNDHLLTYKARDVIGCRSFGRGCLRPSSSLCIERIIL